MKRILFAALVLALVLGMLTPISHGEKPKPEPSKLSALMKSKLENAEKVLDGVAMNDFEKIGKHAEKLIAISKELEWKVLKTPEYELYSNSFRDNARNLVRMARDKNIDGAALAYVDTTLTCVRCHKYVREVRSARLDVPVLDVARMAKAK